jgi:prepilin-type N-terminal cleavage/methylation domain-containing protein
MISSMFFKRSEKGFTLIELLVVIAIIGILSSVVLASLNTARLKSRDTRRIADIKQLQLALALYFDSNSQYPDVLADLAPTYIAAIPTDPVGNAAYFYAGLDTNGVAATCESYHIGAILEEAANPALDGDPDLAGGTICTGSNAQFDGESVACTTTNNVADQCYDQGP